MTYKNNGVSKQSPSLKTESEFEKGVSKGSPSSKTESEFEKGVRVKKGVQKI